jgi:AhpD family alkylhydroperoxidase
MESRISAPPTPSQPWYVRLILRLQRRKYGIELAPTRLWARTPRVFFAFSVLYGALDRASSPLDPGLRSLVQVRVSQLNGCPFCTDINSATGLKRSVSPDKLAALPRFAHSPLFSDPEKAALRYAEAMTRADGGGDHGLSELLKPYFSDDAIIELTALIAFQNMSSKFNAALDVPSQGFCAAAGGQPPLPRKDD